MGRLCIAATQFVATNLHCIATLVVAVRPSTPLTEVLTTLALIGFGLELSLLASGRSCLYPGLSLLCAVAHAIGSIAMFFYIRDGWADATLPLIVVPFSVCPSLLGTAILLRHFGRELGDSAQKARAAFAACLQRQLRFY
ncbi:hypothetical protein SPRG_00402 [Saprolegnia parasitica CBS 223.65]|uniref:Uncharacterized protein n=1 Tax=Saprolegnia parasitica (strain CBS 223.65) TaxID=695850 RepID=A0A067D975_SAPPC|nr:hypothetical protein SPRG_00402 [Saprolegnia parasitica CBS 223.65]KDO35557.1 hypothetical protein SPRG_00402 [Saprolegnia parasitica CBS 223.65]|eukprot:XP_012193891.1 hypothetical protein SPRG_00402 [Saprolegnia parasitica CBS 223.65]